MRISSRLRSSFKFAVSLLLAALAPLAAAQEPPPLDLRSIPISNWLDAGEHAEIPWSFVVRDPILRVDQRLEIAYTVRISGKNLNRIGADHEIFLVSRISSPDGEWLNQPEIVRHTAGQLANNVQLELVMRVVVKPGEYVLWSVLYDRKTGKHNVAKRRLRVSELRGDPLPDLYSRMPLVEFPDYREVSTDSLAFVNGELYLPIRNKRPLHVELISLLSPPEQWTGRNRIMRAHNDGTLGALAALSQMELMDGSLSITGLDLVRRQVMFEQRNFQSIEWKSLLQAMKKAQSVEVSTEALQGAKNNGAFFREILNERLTTDLPADSMRVVIVVTSSRLFESGADLRPLQLEVDCNCRLYYLRFRLNVNDVFDQLDDVMKPLRPRIFNLLTARDLRKAIAEIVTDLAKL